MRLVGAEVLKLVRRRGLMAWSLVLTVGAVVVADGVLLILHAANSAKHGPAGGASNLMHLVDLLSGLGAVAAIMIGATGGSQDVSNGVFRDLVVTGRSRATLFAVRIPGALLVYLPMLLAAFGLAVAGSYAFAGGLPHPTGSDLRGYVEYLIAIGVVNLILAVALAAFVSSRVVVGVLIAWNAIVAHILLQIGSLGNIRKGIDIAAAEHFAPARLASQQVVMSTLTALAVLVAWALVFSGAGRWWTTRRDA